MLVDDELTSGYVYYLHRTHCVCIESIRVTIELKYCVKQDQ